MLRHHHGVYRRTSKFYRLIELFPFFILYYDAIRLAHSNPELYKQALAVAENSDCGLDNNFNSFIFSLINTALVALGFALFSVIRF